MHVPTTRHGQALGVAAPDHESAIRRELLLKRCLRWTSGDIAEAEDLLGDAYLQMMEAAQRRPVTLLKPSSFWLTVINNLGRDRLRRTRRWKRHGDEAAILESLQAQGGSAEDVVLVRECLARAADDLRRLTTKQRSALLLRLNGVDYPQIAELLATSETNARKLVETARGLLAAPRLSGNLERAPRSVLRGQG